MTADTDTRPTPAEAIAWGDRIMSLPGSDHDASPLSVLVDLARDGPDMSSVLAAVEELVAETITAHEEARERDAY